MTSPVPSSIEEYNKSAKNLRAKLREYLSARPHLYDISKRVHRSIFRTTNRSSIFFDAFSRASTKPVRFIQIGANDGLRNDPIREFVVRDKWFGVLIEPLPAIFAMLQANYRHINKGNLIFVNACITSGNNLVFHTYSKEMLKGLSVEEQLWYLRKSSINSAHVLSYAPRSDCVEKISIPCLSINQLISLYWTGGEIDLLVIDAEGYESSIISSIDFRVLNPSIIYFEANHLGKDKQKLYDFLQRNKYSISEIGVDTVALKTDGVGRALNSASLVLRQ